MVEGYIADLAAKSPFDRGQEMVLSSCSSDFSMGKSGDDATEKGRSQVNLVQHEPREGHSCETSPCTLPLSNLA